MRGSTFIEKLCVSLFGGIQPDKLKGYLNQLENGENDGMLQRLQLMVYPDPVPYQRPRQWPDHSQEDKALGIFRSLADMEFTEAGSETNQYNKTPFFKLNQ